MKTHETQAGRCNCGYDLNAASGPEAAPKPGDLGICWECLGTIIYTPEGPRTATNEDLKKVKPETLRRLSSLKRQLAMQRDIPALGN